MATAQTQPAPNPAVQAANANMAARNLLLYGNPAAGIAPAVEMWQRINPTLPSSPGPGSVITFNLRNVGLIKRVIFEIKATVTAGATSTQTLTAFGLPNLISNVTFTDFGNNQRINTYGWHLFGVSTAKRRRVFGAAYTSDTPAGYGNINNRIVYAPSSIAANGSSEIDLMLEIPFVKDDRDLRGILYGDVTNANTQIQITLNPNMFVSSTADPTLAVYQSGGSDLASISSISIQATQVYLDQIPRINGKPVLPVQDLTYAYLLNQAVSTLPTAAQDNSTAFTNARFYESVMMYYDNNGTLNANGSDLNYVRLTSANFTNIRDYDPKVLGLKGRNLIMNDFPKGMYFLDFRDRPIDTNQYGNMQLTINPSSVGGSSAYLGFGFESYGLIGQVNQGGAIASGA